MHPCLSYPEDPAAEHRTYHGLRCVYNALLVLQRCLEQDRSETAVQTVGPPPRVDASSVSLDGHRKSSTSETLIISSDKRKESGTSKRSMASVKAEARAKAEAGPGGA